MEKTGDFYDLLGVHKAASGEEIRARYHQLAMVYHPDRAQETDKETAHRVFVRINQAYRTLIDPDQRERYDQRLAARRTGPPLAAEPPKEYPATDDEIREWMGEASDSYARGDLQSAHVYCRRIIKSGHAPAEAYVLIGDVYVGEREKAKALTAYQVALKMQPQNKMVLAKVRRMEEVLHRRDTHSEMPAGPETQNTPAGKRSLLARLAQMRGRKQT